MSFPKGLNARLSIRDRILEVYILEDLQEVCMLDNLDDSRSLVKLNEVTYDLNVFRQNNGWKCVIYDTIQNNLDEWSFDSNSFKNVKIIVDEG